jgi:hypothetical protein
LRFDSPPDEIDYFITGGYEREVQVAALDFGPVVTGLDAQPSRILCERLVQDADND